ncbi:MAG: single-stranded DNA-binding protein [Devosia sp.]
MASVNKVTLIGNCGKDVELRYLPNGDAVANVSVATTETWKDKDGAKQEKTEWTQVTFFRRLAEVAGQYLKKGDSVYVEGKLDTKKWTDKAGVERYTTGVIAHEMKMLGNRDQSQSREPAQKQEKYIEPSGKGFDDMDDDIPF